MTELEVQEKIEELRSKRQTKRDEIYPYDLTFGDDSVEQEKKEGSLLSVMTTQSIIVVIIVILYILALTFFPVETKKSVAELKSILHNDFSFKDSVYQVVGDLITDLNLSDKSNDVTASEYILDGKGGERTNVAVKTVPYNATLADVIYTGSITFPVTESRNTSMFGFRTNPITGLREFHNAIDIAAVTGTPILAVANGVVERSGYDSSLGNFIVIDHSNGFKTKYGHCSELLIKAGDFVKEGDVIAKVGSTGDSTGPHLHFAASKNGVYFNPQHLYSYVEKWSEEKLDD